MILLGGLLALVLTITWWTPFWNTRRCDLRN